MKDPQQKVLAIDFGTTRIGLAVSFVNIADPLTIIPNDENTFQYIAQVVNQYSIKIVIVGLSENLMADKTKLFVLQLSKVLNIPVEMFDETLSSQTVRKKLKQAGKASDQPIDHLAAAEILQNWLDEHQIKKQQII